MHYSYYTYYQKCIPWFLLLLTINESPHRYSNAVTFSSLYRLLCERADKFLRDASGEEEGLELAARLGVLRDSLAELRHALDEHELASPATSPLKEQASDQQDEATEEGVKGKEHKEQANAARLRRSSCRRRVSHVTKGSEQWT